MIISIENQSIFRDAKYMRDEAIIIPVNSVGVMGKGLALAAKRKYPSLAKEYGEMHSCGVLKPGWVGLVEGDKMKNIPNFAVACTKNHWKDPSQYEWIQKAVRDLAWTAPRFDIRCLKIPPLGCGLGGLEWDRVKPMIQEVFEPLTDLTAIVYEPVRAI